MSGDSSDSTSASIIRRVQAEPRNNEHWVRFKRVYDPAIHRWLRRWGLQPADVDDVAQDVLKRLFEKLPGFTYDPARSFRGWLKTVVHNVWHDFATSRRRDRDGTADGLTEVPARTDLERELEETYDQELLEWAMTCVKGRVAPATWEAFERTAIGLEPPQAVADALKIGVALVYVHKSKVTRLIRETIRAADAGA
ncbi:MAG TPA: sigma-70 family RNA polymerase sigma factor [Urbifossiella sp.]|jgi:RNA polymerase sigma-70 factor (ECF subfamily)|nr:sigma-70 family RNA polymerase sigma factor [Urbifossiella sp.]